MDGSTVITYENTIGSLTFRRDGLMWLTGLSGASGMEVGLYESQSAGQAGATLIRQTAKPRPITLDGALFEPLHITRAELLRVLAPLVPSTLTITQGGESWYLDVVPEYTPEISDGAGSQQFQARLRASYPYWRTVEQYSTQLAGLISRFRFPLDTAGSWYISQYSTSRFAEVVNQGNLPAEFRVTFAARAALSDPELYDVHTGQRIKLVKTMAAGDKLVVSTVWGERGAISILADGTRSNGFRYLTVDSSLNMTLRPGVNLFRASAAVNPANLTVRIDAPKGVRSGV